MSFGFYFALFLIIVLVVLGFIFYQKLKNFLKDPLGVFSFMGDMGKGIGKGLGGMGKGMGNGLGDMGKGIGGTGKDTGKGVRDITGLR